MVLRDTQGNVTKQELFSPSVTNEVLSVKGGGS